jgi:hypothetical protein
MRRDRNHTIAAVVLLAALVAGCSERQVPATPAATLGAPASAQPTTQPPPSTPPTEPVAQDPYAIPANPKDIDKAYVERVLQELMGGIAEAGRELARERTVTRKAMTALRVRYTREAARGVVRELRMVAKRNLIDEVFGRKAQPPVINMKRVITATSQCIFTFVGQDTAPLGGKEVPPFPAYYELTRKRPGVDPDMLNATPWVIAADAEPMSGGKEYSDPCK